MHQLILNFENVPVCKKKLASKVYAQHLCKLQRVKNYHFFGRGYVYVWDYSLGLRNARERKSLVNRFFLARRCKVELFFFLLSDPFFPFISPFLPNGLLGLSFLCSSHAWYKVTWKSSANAVAATQWLNKAI